MTTLKLDKFLEADDEDWLDLDTVAEDATIEDEDDLPEIEIEVEDDTPEEDKGKPVADLDAEDESEDHAAEIEDTLKKNRVSAKQRIQQLTAEKHAYRRAAEERNRQLESLLDFTKKQRARLESLEKIVPAGYGMLKDSNLRRADAERDLAQAALERAAENGDTKAVAEWTGKLARIEAHREQVLQMQVPEEPMTVPEIPQYQAPAIPSETMTSWAGKNPWFFDNAAMRDAAMAKHREIVAEKKIPVESPEYFAIIESEVKSKYPAHFAKAPAAAQASTEKPTQAAKPASTSVATPVVRTGPSGAKLKLKPKASEKAVAEMLGIDVKGYLLEKQYPGYTLRSEKK